MTKFKIRNPNRPVWISLVSLIAIIFGLATIKEGGAVLFTAAGEKSAGNYVPFVLWFNFIAGFAYILTGVGLFQLKTYSRQLAPAIALSTSIVFLFLGIHIFNGGAFETRTIAAMTMRSSFWILIAVSVLRTKAFKHFNHQRQPGILND